MASWDSHMRYGHFEAAWAVSDRVMRTRAPGSCAHLPRHMQHVWDGSPLAGRRVLIRCYHGLGDTIQFIRYAPLVRAVAREVSVWAQAELIPLLQTAPGVDRLEALHDGSPELEYDVDVECMELAHVFRTTLATIPASIPYLAAPRAQLLDDGRLKIGLACKAGEWDGARSVPLELLAPLGVLSGVDVRLLHPSHAANLPPGISVAAGTDSSMGTASLMRAMDLVISVDSMPAHLAGALGVPVWTLLRREADWRWMVGREDSPWYPTMRLFRQPCDGGWSPVIERVVSELAARGDE